MSFIAHCGRFFSFFSLCCCSFRGHDTWKRKKYTHTMTSEDYYERQKSIYMCEETNGTEMNKENRMNIDIILVYITEQLNGPHMQYIAMGSWKVSHRDEYEWMKLQQLLYIIHNAHSAQTCLLNVAEVPFGISCVFECVLNCTNNMYICININYGSIRNDCVMHDSSYHSKVLLIRKKTKKLRYWPCRGFFVVLIWWSEGGVCEQIWILLACTRHCAYAFACYH